MRNVSSAIKLILIPFMFVSDLVWIAITDATSKINKAEMGHPCQIDQESYN